MPSKSKNSMKCYYLPMPKFQEKMAALVVHTGSNHISFLNNDTHQLETFPKGTAHFIEHKLFRQNWGDAYSAFLKQGASPNAFTDAEKTVYYFTCQDNFMENLRLLLSFVQNPYFLEEEIAQEKQIIKSEISMYNDNPYWLVYYQLLSAMYKHHPVKNPIAGDHTSVDKIDAQILQQAYQSMYTTDRFTLICGGNISIRKIEENLAMVQENIAKNKPFFEKEPKHLPETYVEQSINLSQPIFQIGFKMPPTTSKTTRIYMPLLLEMLTGESSDFYETALTKKFLHEPLGTAYLQGSGYAFSVFGGEGLHAKETSELLLETIKAFKQNGIPEEVFRRIKKKHIGTFIRQSQSVYTMVMAQANWSSDELSATEVFRYIKAVQKIDLEKLLQNTLIPDKMILSVLR